MLKVFGFGNLVRDPEIKSVGNSNVVNFSIASNEYRKTSDGETQKTAHYVDLEAWDSAATTISKIAKKGDGFTFTGRIRQNRWEDSEGKNRSKIIIRVDEFKVHSRQPRTEQDAETPQEVASTPEPEVEDTPF